MHIARGQAIASIVGRALGAAGSELPDDESLLACSDALMRAGAGPLAWWAIRHDDHRATAVRDRFRDAYRYQAGRSLSIDADLQQLWMRLEDAQIDALIAKGPVAAAAYPEAALRPFGDFDVYVREDAGERARVALAGVRLRRHAIDLHAGLSYLDDMAFDDVRAGAQRLRVGKAEALAPSEELHLRLVALHALAEGVMRPLWLSDVALLTLHRRPSFDWRIFLAGDPWRARWASLAIVLAWQVFGLPDHTLPQPLQDRRLPPWCVPSLLRTWGRDAGTKGSRPPFGAAIGLRARARELHGRWPTPFEAVSGVRGPIPARWPIGVQLVECLRRIRAARATA